MTSFYRNLSEGKRKDESLHLAKLAFLEENHDTNFSHPYYWSGFVLSGNVDPIVSEDYKPPLNKNYIYWLVIGLGFLILLILIGFVFYKRNLKKV